VNEIIQDSIFVVCTIYNDIQFYLSGIDRSNFKWHNFDHIQNYFFFLEKYSKLLYNPISTLMSW